MITPNTTDSGRIPGSRFLRRTALRVGLPVATAAAALLLSAPAWASTLAAPPPAPVGPDQCHSGGGQVWRDPHVPSRYYCHGGRWAGRFVHF